MREMAPITKVFELFDEESFLDVLADLEEPAAFDLYHDLTAEGVDSERPETWELPDN